MKQLETFLYLLARDHLPVGVIEAIVRRSEKGDEDDVVFTNKDLANIASKWKERIYGA